MSAIGPVVDSRKFSTFERALLIFAPVFLVSDAVAGYVAMHDDRVIEAIIVSFSLIFAGAFSLSPQVFALFS
jgi:hypothetical protein